MNIINSIRNMITPKKSEQMEESRNKKNFLKIFVQNKIYIWIFFVITLVFSVVWIVNQIYPFEERTLVIVDGVHQYIPFFSEYYEKIKNGESLFYSFHIGMGDNFYSLFSYYLSSPLNLFVLLFPKDKLYFSLSLLIYIKILLSGIFFAYYFIHRPTETLEKEKQGLIEERKKEVSIIGFSLAYALSSYCMGYYWNIMWMDVIYLLPIVILGMERLMKEKKIVLYVLSLSYCLYCNYYMAFMVCIFLVLYFFTFQPSSAKVFIKNGLRFAVSSLLAGGISAFILLPAYWGIKTTAAGGTMESGLPEWKWYGHLKETLVSQLILNKPIIMDNYSSWKANLYCSILVLFLVSMFFFIKRESLYRKFVITGIFILFYISYDNELLNYIWHGFHKQNGLPNRMVFLCNFLLLVIGYEVLKKQEEISWHGIGFGCLASMGFVLFLWKENNGLDSVVFSTSLLLIAFYVLIFAAKKWKKLNKMGFYRTITVVLSIEVALTALLGMTENGFIHVEKMFGASENLEVAKEYLEQEEMNEFYRTEIDSRIIYLNETTYHNLNGISVFCSTVDGNMVSTLGNLGFYNSLNMYMHQGSTPFTDSILGVRHVIKKQSRIKQEQINTFSLIKEFGEIKIYENQTPLALGFKVTKDLSTFKKAESVFETQNQLAYKMTGENTLFYEMVSKESFVTTTDNITITKQTGMEYSFKKNNLESAVIKVQIPIEQDMDLYLYPDGDYISAIQINLDSEVLVNDGITPKRIYDIGFVKKGQILTVEYEIQDYAIGKVSLAVYMAKYIEENFRTHYEVLSQDQLMVKQLDANLLECISDDKDGGLYFTSIPYDDGFEIMVDGKKQDALILADAFLGFELAPLQEGEKEHKITIKFIPVGLKEGIIISVSSICIFILLLCLQRRWNKK